MPRMYTVDPLRYAWEGINAAPYPATLSNRWTSTPEGPQQGRRGRDIILSPKASRAYDERVDSVNSKKRVKRESAPNLLSNRKLKHADINRDAA